MWKYTLSDKRKVKIICNFQKNVGEVIIKMEDEKKNMFLGDFMIQENEKMSNKDLQHFTKMVKIFSESAEVLRSGNKCIELRKSFRIFSPEIQAQFEQSGDVPSVSENFEITLKNSFNIKSEEKKDEQPGTNNLKNIRPKIENIFVPASQQIQLGQSEIKNKYENMTTVFQCTICNRCFKKRGNLKMHIAKSHKDVGSKPYKCQECTETFRQRVKLVLHMRNHRINQIKSEMSNQSLAGNIVIEKHTEQNHGIEQRLSCALCGKEDFLQQTELNRHIVMNHVGHGS